MCRSREIAYADAYRKVWTFIHPEHQAEAETLGQSGGLRLYAHRCLSADM